MPDIKNPNKLTSWGFLVGCEVDISQITPEKIAMRLADSLSYVEGVGFTDVEVLGEIDRIEDDGEDDIFTPEGNA